MIKVDTIKSGTKVEVQGEKIEVFIELLTAIDSIMRLFPDEMQDALLDSLPEVVRDHRTFFKTEIHFDADILNKIKGEE